ncbi:hypothetical protein [Burkholderia cenocepacia]|uniref:hypothetical protein n=1 Tax=Burkholderia cenocepacia TaxID=95486 RepID=UPI002AB70602|nr:hypothetical protein [Burkholderia cenocepacia]
MTNMKTIALWSSAVVVLATVATSIPAQVFQTPVGTPNVGGCQPPRQWTMRDGWYQCVMPPVAPGGGSPGGGALTDADLALLCSRYAVSKGYNANPNDEDPGHRTDDHIFLASDRTPGGDFVTQNVMGPGRATWDQCAINGRPDSIIQCRINSAGTVVWWGASTGTCNGGGG